METEIVKDRDVEAWLSECRTKGTREIYLWRTNLFFKWLEAERKLGLQEWKALTPKEMKTLALQFQNSEPKGEGHVFHSKHKHQDTKSHDHVLEPKRLSNNTVSGILTALQSFCVYLEKPLAFKRGARFATEDDDHSHYFVNGDLAKMYDVSDFKGKAILAVATSLGWEVSDFLALDRPLVEAEEERQQYVYFETRRTKTHVPRLAVLNPLAIEALKNWLPQNPTRTLFDMTKGGIVKFMQRCAKKANLTTTGPVRFHRIRAWTFNSLLKAGFGDSEAKYIVGKAIPHSDGTYLRLREGIEQKYPKFYNEHLNIKPSAIRLEKVMEIEQMKQDYEQRIKALENQFSDIIVKYGLEKAHVDYNKEYQIKEKKEEQA